MKEMVCSHLRKTKRKKTRKNERRKERFVGYNNNGKRNDKKVRVNVHKYLGRV